MRRHWVAALVLGLLASPAALAQAPVIGPPVNAFSFGPELSPGVLATMGGQNLSASGGDCLVSALPYPTVLPPCNAMVLINGEAAPISFNNATTINFQFPFDEVPGPAGPSAPVEIVVDVDGVRSEPVMVELRRFAPALATVDGSGTGIGAFSRFGGDAPGLITTENRAAPGDILSGFAVGLGPTDPPVPAGTAAQATVLVPPKVFIHGAAKAVREAQVLGAVLASSAVGFYQVNFILPDDLPLPSDPGYFYRVELVIEDGGEEFRSSQVLLPVQQGDHEITGVCDAAGCQELVSPGSIASIFGNFAEQMAVADSIPLSMNLNGYSVTFNGIPGALLGVFPGQDGAQDQANVQAPWGIDVSSGTIEVQVHWEDDTGTVWSEPFTANAAQASPGIFLLGPRAIVTNFSLGDDDVITGSWAQPEGFSPPPDGTAGGDWRSHHRVVRGPGTGDGHAGDG